MNVPGAQYINAIMQNAATAVGNGTPMDCTAAARGAMTVLTMQVQGITTATITFEATIDGTNWVAIQVTNLTSGALATTTTADGLFRVTVLGLVRVRARISAYTSGTITVTGMLTS